MRRVTLLLILISFSCLSQIEENLLLHYKFDGNTLDETENQFDGLPNGVTYANDRFGNENSAVHFDGINDFIDLPNLSALKPQLPVSFSFWIKYDSPDYTNTEVFNTSFQEDESSGIYFNTQASNGNYAVNFGDGSPFYNPNARRSYVSSLPIDTARWHQVIVIVNASLDMKIYIDCKEYGGSYTGNGGDLFYSMGSGSIGRNDRDLNAPANYFKGSLDDFRYWDKALSYEDIGEVCSELGLSEFSSDNFNIYPNPAQEIVHIQSKNGLSFHLDIFDSLGKRVLSTNSENEINISNLSNGLYFLNFSSEKNIQTKKLIINR